MKCIKVRIDQLGRIRDSEILVSPLMVFSGESGLGKSYLALLCHYFFELLINTSRLNHFFVDNNIDFNILSKDFKDVGTALEIKKQDLETWMAKDAILYLRYMLGYDGISGQIEITLPESVPDTMAFTYKNELTGLVDKEEIYTILSLGNLRFRIQEKTQFDESPFAFLLRFVLIDYIFGNYQKLDSTFVLPPSRGPILTEQIIPTTGMYSEFLSDMAGLNRIKPRPDTASEIVLKLFRTILEGEVDKEETTYIYTTNDASMPVSAAAASIREIAPLQILAKKQDVYFLRRLNELIMFAKAKKTTDDPDKLRTLSEKVNIVEDMSIDESIIGAYLLRKQADNTSIAVKQDISNGIPFAAFRDAILDNMNYQDILGDYLQDVTE